MSNHRLPAPVLSSRPRLLCGLLLALSVGGSAASARDEEAARRRAEARALITPQLRHSVSRAFRFLLRRQRETRSFRQDTYPVAVNALFGMALLADGNSADAGREDRVEALRRSIATLLSFQTPEGYFHDGQSRMYGHGFATLFLAEAYGMSADQDVRLRESLRLAIRVIEKSQGGEGGWDYEPARRFGGRKTGQSDTSITVCQTMALRAARNLGLAVDAGVVRRAERYIRGAQNPDGGFRYRSTRTLGMGGSALPRSAAGVCILYSLGDYSSPEIRKGIRYLEDHYRDRNDFPYYAQYYCAQAMFQVGGRRWTTYFSWARSVLLREQEADGSWRTGALRLVERNPCQTTAMGLIIALLPYRLLPIHER